MWPFRFVAVLAYGRQYGSLWLFRFRAFRFVTVFVVAISDCGRYDLLPGRLRLVYGQPGGRLFSYWGVRTKPISCIPLFSEFFSIVKTHVSYWIPRLCLTGAAVIQLRWHLSNMNVISNNLRGTFARSKILLIEKLTNRTLVTPPLICLWPSCSIHSIGRSRAMSMDIFWTRTCARCTFYCFKYGAFVYTVRRQRYCEKASLSVWVLQCLASVCEAQLI